MHNKTYEELLINVDKYMRLTDEEKNNYIKQFFIHFMYIETIIQNQTDELAAMNDLVFKDNPDLTPHMNHTKKLYTDNPEDEQKLDTIYRLAEYIVTNEDLINKFISTYSSRFKQTNKVLNLIELNDNFIMCVRCESFELPDGLPSIVAVEEKIRNEIYELLMSIRPTQEFLFYGILYAWKSTHDLLIFPFTMSDGEFEELYLEPDDRTICIIE